MMNRIKIFLIGSLKEGDHDEMKNRENEVQTKTIRINTANAKSADLV